MMQPGSFFSAEKMQEKVVAQSAANKI